MFLIMAIVILGCNFPEGWQQFGKNLQMELNPHFCPAIFGHKWGETHISVQYQGLQPVIKPSSQDTKQA